MICIPIMALNNGEALKKMAQAAPFADVLELRLDVMEGFDLKELIEVAPRPVLVTYRSKKDGGRGAASYGTRIRHLVSAIEAGADFVDVEYHLPLEYRQELFLSRGGSRLILSVHLLNGTSSREALDGILRKMAGSGADIVKIVTYAKAWEDTLGVLGLIPEARSLGVKIIAFAMGPMGRISRVLAHLMGGFLTFASLEVGEESASGQISIGEMKKVLEILSHEC
jgi:3-dehydroquinate dehydratase type I